VVHPSRCHSRVLGRFPVRGLTALGLSALLVVAGVPHAALAASAAPADLQDPQGGCGIAPADAVRFLEQATFGPSFVTNPSDPNYPLSVAHLTQDTCYEGWVQEQFNTPVLWPDDASVPTFGTNYFNPNDPGACDDGVGDGWLCWVPPNVATTCTNNGTSTCARDNYQAYLLQRVFFQNALVEGDQLRQRVAWALTGIDVASQNATIVGASWMVPYLQLFDRNALGNYRQLLSDLTINPAMGEYLNMRGNTKNSVNENYARELLQLFTIGVNELNDDGTLQVDDAGNPIPTYSQDVITNFARVFTGWNLAPQIAPGVPNYRDPMIVANENNHDTKPKTLLNGVVLPGGAPAADELQAALDNIFNNHNVGPFIGKALIQKLVTSNPGPDYVQHVTAAFNTGNYTGPGGTAFGSGARGDMQAVVAAVLLDPEARTPPSDSTFGHLREPVLFITNTLRALGGIVDANGNPTTDYVLGDSFLPSGANANVRMDEDVFRPPTVFSYYSPSNQLAGSTLLAPEFGIQSTSTSLARINLIYDFAYHRMPTNVKNSPLGTWIDTTPYEREAAGDASALIDDLDMRLMHGNLSTPIGQALRGVVQTAVQAIPETDLRGRVQEAIYLIASSSQYQVER
jgi:uncharacterized protein (DUF1800 family)